MSIFIRAKPTRLESNKNSVIAYIKIRMKLILQNGLNSCKNENKMVLYEYVIQLTERGIDHMGV